MGGGLTAVHQLPQNARVPAESFSHLLHHLGPTPPPHSQRRRTARYLRSTRDETKNYQERSRVKAAGIPPGWEQKTLSDSRGVGGCHFRVRFEAGEGDDFFFFFWGART